MCLQRTVAVVECYGCMHLIRYPVLRLLVYVMTFAHFLRCGSCCCCCCCLSSLLLGAAAMSPAKLCKVTNAFRPECVGESRRSVKFYEVCQETYSTSCTFPCAELRCNCLEGYSRTAQGICKKDAVVSISGGEVFSCVDICIAMWEFTPAPVVMVRRQS